MRRSTKRPGLILLVVLGMLALFSLLAVTYVVFASQSRAASVALAREETRGNKSRKPLFEEAIRQLLRGSKTDDSITYGHSILGDLYGDVESLFSVPAVAIPHTRVATRLTIRNWAYDPVTPLGQTQQMTYASSSYQRPMILAGHYLRIPLDPGGYGNNLGTSVPVRLPVEHDALNGRVVTFPEGSGPLSGQSFHIVRYIGRMTPYQAPVSAADQIAFAQNYSIVIDLLEGDLSKSFSKFDEGTQRLQTFTVAEWLNAYPPGNGNGPFQAGIYACYNRVDPSSNRLLNEGYELLLNAAPLNSHGIGVYNDGSSQTHSMYPPTHSLASASVNNIASGLLPNLRLVTPTGLSGGTGGLLIGDTDEPYDAADYANWFLSHRYSGATTSADVIPSFHRASLINYIANWKDPQGTNYTAEDFIATVSRIEMAVGRPLSITVAINDIGFNYESHPKFTGGNNGTLLQSPKLDVQLSTWNDWPTQGLPRFLVWVNWLTQGPWDVDNDGDGIPDSIWVDVNLPLENSADGKLLKALVAYYVEDLDSKLDVNATGSFAQTATANFSSPLDAQFARHNNNQATYLPQGLGYGPAENSVRHLFAKAPLLNPPYLTGTPQFLRTRQDLGYQELLKQRYRANPLDQNYVPARFGDDSVSHLRMRQWFYVNGGQLQRRDFVHGLLPGLPMGTHGRAMMALDRLGNPRLLNIDNAWSQTVEDPYESRWSTSGSQDSAFTLSEWERIYRVGDGDRSALPSRLEQLFGELPNTIGTSSLRHEITTRSAHLRVPALATRGLGNSTIPTTFIEMVNTVRELRGQAAIPLNKNQLHRGFASLFPMEFVSGAKFDVNRPFGNGVDDDNDGQIDEPQELFAFFPEQPVYTTGSTVSNRVNSFVNHLTDYLRGQPWYVPAGGANPEVRPFDPNITYQEETATPKTPAIYQHSLETRQLYARHLYCLAQLIIPDDYVFPNVDKATYSALGAAEKTAERARILAQWAVNVVDFRDADAAMTRFPYDPAPLAPKGTAPNEYYAWEPPADTVVWGMEQPELLMTESFAAHDIRIKRDETGSPRYDQYRIPQGSLYLEFFCPRTTDVAGDRRAAGVPRSLYNNSVALDLGRMAPAGANGITAVPVWRVYISDPQTPGSPTPLTRYNTADEKHLLSMQIPESNHRYDSVGTVNPNAQQEARESGFVFDRSPTPVTPPDPEEARILVFAGGFSPTVSNSPGVADPEAQVFVNQGSNVQLRGGQYLAVGPRSTTNFGSKISSFSDPTQPVNHPNNHRIAFSGNWVQMYETNNTSVARRGTMRDCVTMVAAGRVPTGWQGNNDLRQETGLNVSEPLPQDANYYQMPTTTVNPNDNGTDPDNGAVGFGHNSFKDDAYFDYTSGPPTALAPFDDGSANSGPLEEWTAGVNMTTNAVNLGTQDNWCTAYLQRLADPEKPWDAAYNPYITVDWIPIDLSVYSGEESHVDVYPAGLELRFSSRQKTGHPLQNVSNQLVYNTTDSTVTGQTFYSSATHSPRETIAAGGGQNYFDYEVFMDDTLGTTNAPIRPTAVDLRPSTDAGHVNETFMTFGFLNSTYRIAGEEGSVSPGAFTGQPGDPSQINPADTTNYGLNPNWFPASLYWANRDFVNPYELASVPLSAPGQIMQEFGTMDDGSGAGSRYEKQNGGNPLIPFPHLLSFFHDYDAARPGSGMPDGAVGIPMASLFDLVETASPWADANEFLDPRSVDYQDPSSVNSDLAPLVASSNNILATLRAPYNRLSRYVEPGRVNLNTIAEENVFQGVWYNSLTPLQRQQLGSASNAWNIVFNSRRGYVPGGGPNNFDPGRLNTAYPTQFAGIFKPAMEAGRVPATRGGALDATAMDAPANVTLLRQDPSGLNNGGPMIYDSTQGAAPMQGNLQERNAFTDMYPISRLANLTTNRSNVFAVYTTIAFFEYDESTGQLLQEYGADQGEAQRFKAFYIVDRSKPVAFEAGVDHNVENAILVRRFLKTEE